MCDRENGKMHPQSWIFWFQEVPFPRRDFQVPVLSFWWWCTQNCAKLVRTELVRTSCTSFSVAQMVLPSEGLQLMYSLLAAWVSGVSTISANKVEIQVNWKGALVTFTQLKKPTKKQNFHWQSFRKGNKPTCSRCFIENASSHSWYCIWNMIPYHKRSSKPSTHPRPTCWRKVLCPYWTVLRKLFLSKLFNINCIKLICWGEWLNKTNLFSLSAAPASPHKFTSEILFIMLFSCVERKALCNPFKKNTVLTYFSSRSRDHQMILIRSCHSSSVAVFSLWLAFLTFPRKLFCRFIFKACRGVFQSLSCCWLMGAQN